MAEAMATETMECIFVPATELEQRISHICENIKKLRDIQEPLEGMTKHWAQDIETKNETPRDIYKNGAVFQAPITVFNLFFMHFEKNITLISQKVKEVLHDLQGHIQRWKTHQLHECVKRRLESGPEDTAYVEKLCEQVCGMVRLLLDCEKNDLTTAYRLKIKTGSSSIPVPVPITPLRQAIQEILSALVQLCFVVIEQPQLTMMFEKDKKDKDDSNNSKKFDTTVGLLGGKELGNYIEMTDVVIKLVYQGDLARGNTLDFPHAKICSEIGRHRHSSRSVDSPDLPYQRKYEKLRVEDFRRRESRTVYKQLYHVIYTAQLIFGLAKKEVVIPAKVISLPVIMRTGANQASEHVGALLWHSFSSHNVYDLHAGMVTSMSIDRVIQMTNERILYIGGRGLQDYERQFLHDRLSVTASSGRKKHSDITLDNFVKDKVELVTGGEKHTRPFSLWLWLHSIFNLLQETLQDPWKHGVIYGFASREHCKMVLEDPSVPDGTFLLRFSESYRPGNYMMCKGAVALVVKMNGKACFAPPTQAEAIEREGLAQAVEQNGCQIELTSHLHISELRQRYQPSVQDNNNTVFLKERYQEWSGQATAVTSRPMKLATKRSCDKVMPQSPNYTKYNCSSPPQSPQSGASSSAASIASAFSPASGQDQSWMSPPFTSSMGSPPPAANFSVGSPVSSSLQMASPTSSSLQMTPPTPTSLHMASLTPSSLQMTPPTPTSLHMASLTPSSLQMTSPTHTSLHMASLTPSSLQMTSPTPTSLHMASQTSSSLQMTSPTPTSLHMDPLTPSNLHMASPTPSSLHTASPASSSSLQVTSSVASSCPEYLQSAVSEIDERLLQDLSLNPSDLTMLAGSEEGQAFSDIFGNPAITSQLVSGAQHFDVFVSGEDPMMTMQSQ